MILYPAIDLQNGCCVRLYQGDFSHATSYSVNPITTAKNFVSEGAEWLHIIDLDGAKDPKQKQENLIIDITNNVNVKIQVGGGIREKKQIKNYLDNNIARVIVGSLAVNQPELVKEWLHYFGSNAIVLALDVLWVDDHPYVATHGWQTNSHQPLMHLLEYYQKSISHVLCTDVSRDGTLQGPNHPLYRDLSQRFPEIQLQASGGISSLIDLKYLKEIAINGAVIGKALYEKKFTLTEALQC